VTFGWILESVPNKPKCGFIHFYAFINDFQA